MKSKTDILVFISNRDSTCGECGENLGRKAWITLREDKGAVCLACADLEHLVFLPAGDAALTTRSRKYSKLSAVVLKWSKSRNRYERQGLLVETEALEKAEAECLSDADARARQRERGAEKRIELDTVYIAQFAARGRELFPNCPPDRDEIIARHACLKYSGRVGRSAAAKNLDEHAVRLAVIAHLRHPASEYDKLLSKGFERSEARQLVQADVTRMLELWSES